MIGLFAPEIVIEAIGFGEQLSMRALLDNPTLLQHQDLVRVHDGDETMRDTDARASLHQRLERLQDIVLGDRVQAGRGLVVHKNGRALQHDPRDRHALLLASAQLEPAFAHKSGVLLGHAHDRVVHVRHARRLVHLLGRAREIAVVDVVQDGVVEQNGVLRHDAQRFTQRAQRDVEDVCVVDEDPARCGIVETEQKTHDRRFAAAAAANDGDLLAGGHFEAQVL